MVAGKNTEVNLWNVSVQLSAYHIWKRNIGIVSIQTNKLCMWMYYFNHSARLRAAQQAQIACLWVLLGQPVYTFGGAGIVTGAALILK